MMSSPAFAQACQLKPAAIYARVSSERQDVDLSVSAQLRALRDFAAKQGYAVVKEYVDEAESGRTTARPAFREMVAAARRPTKTFDAVLVWKYSRFARSREDSIVFKTLFRKHGVQVVSITEPTEDTPTGRLMEAIIESLDEFYSANLGQEVLRGMRESASRGFQVIGCTPYGYKRVKVHDGSKERAKLAPDEHKAPVVGRIFQDVLAGKGMKEIARTLTMEGVAAPGKSGWNKTTLHGILCNEVYTGTLVWGAHSRKGSKVEPVRVEDAWPAIVDKPTYLRAQALLELRAPQLIHPRRAASHYLLSGIARCGGCGKALIGQDAKNGKFSYYVCGTLMKKGAGTCSAGYLNAKRFESLVVDKIKERVLTEDNLRKLVELVNEEMDAATVEYRKRNEAIASELADVQRRLDRLFEALETRSLTLNDLAPRIQSLRQRQEELQATRIDVEGLLANRRVEISDLKTVVRYVADLRNLLSESSFAEQKAFIRSFVKEIKVTGKEATLTYSLPMPPEGATEDKTGVLSIVRYGSAYRIRTGGLRLERAAS